MKKDVQKLQKLTAEFADSNRPVTSYGIEMMEFVLLIRRLADSHRGFTAKKQSGSPSYTETGVAIDPWRASLSADDHGRTVGFIRGCVRAVERVLKNNPGQPVHFIEAGCGPLAVLSLPLMARFGADQLQVTLIDLHEESVDTARYIIDQLGVSDRLKNTICGDLMEIEFDDPVDVIVLETMYAALFNEPQVALTRRLVRVLPGAIFIPEVISVDLQLLDLALEVKTMPPQVRERQSLGRVFVLDRSSALRNEAEVDYLPAATISIPVYVNEGLKFFLTTSMVLFDDVCLADYDAEITAPIGLPHDGTWLGNDIRFRYRINESPGLEWETVSTQNIDA